MFERIKAWFDKGASGAETSAPTPWPGVGEVDVRSEAAARAEAQCLGPVVSGMLRELGAQIRPGVTTQALADQLREACTTHQLRPDMEGHHGFPAVAAISVNDEIVHGIPGQRKLCKDDLVKVEFSVSSRLGFGSQSWTFACGALPKEDRLLFETGPRALRAAIATLRGGSRVGDISAALQTTIESANLAVVRDFVGYRMGAVRMCAPQIPGFGIARRGPQLEAGSVLNVYAILKHGSYEVTIDDNDWTARSADGKRGALFTCMVEVTPEGHNLLTPLLDSLTLRE
jgi:methionyl aminopeptidase